MRMLAVEQFLCLLTRLPFLLRLVTRSRKLLVSVQFMTGYSEIMYQRVLPYMNLLQFNSVTYFPASLFHFSRRTSSSRPRRQWMISMSLSFLWRPTLSSKIFARRISPRSLISLSTSKRPKICSGTRFPRWLCTASVDAQFRTLKNCQCVNFIRCERECCPSFVVHWVL